MKFNRSGHTLEPLPANIPFSMSRQKAEYLGYDEHPYDALLDLYEEGLTGGQITDMFKFN